MNNNKKRYPIFNSPKTEELQAFNTLVTAGDFAQSKEFYDIAENFYKLAADFSIDTWGPYQWPEANALLSLSYLYSIQKRYDESEVTWFLSIKILKTYD